MSDLVERLGGAASGLDYIAMLIENGSIDQGSERQSSAVSQAAATCIEAAARITELETALAEAEGRVKDQIVNAIKTHPNFGDEDFGPGLDLAISIATAGEWKK